MMLQKQTSQFLQSVTEETIESQTFLPHVYLLAHNLIID